MTGSRQFQRSVGGSFFRSRLQSSRNTPLFNYTAGRIVYALWPAGGFGTFSGVSFGGVWHGDSSFIPTFSATWPGSVYRTLTASFSDNNGSGPVNGFVGDYFDTGNSWGTTIPLYYRFSAENPWILFPVTNALGSIHYEPANPVVADKIDTTTISADKLTMTVTYWSKGANQSLPADGTYTATLSSQVDYDQCVASCMTLLDSFDYLPWQFAYDNGLGKAQYLPAMIGYGMAPVENGNVLRGQLSQLLVSESVSGNPFPVNSYSLTPVGCAGYGVPVGSISNPGAFSVLGPTSTFDFPQAAGSFDTGINPFCRASVLCLKSRWRLNGHPWLNGNYPYPSNNPANPAAYDTPQAFGFNIVSGAFEGTVQTPLPRIATPALASFSASDAASVAGGKYGMVGFRSAP